jgi:hypothetical protein
MNAANKVLDRTVVGTNEDTVFGRITKMWGNGHCRAIIQWNDVRAELNKVRIPKNRLGKKGSTPITLSSVVAIFVGRDFDVNNLKEGDQFDISAVLDTRQARALVKQELAPGWFLKSADEIASGVSMGPVSKDEGWEWDTTEDSDEDEVTGDAVTKKQLRELKKSKSHEAPREVPEEGSNLYTEWVEAI